MGLWSLLSLFMIIIVAAVIIIIIIIIIIIRSFNLYNWDPHRVLRELHSEFGVSAFFEVIIQL